MTDERPRSRHQVPPDTWGEAFASVLLELAVVVGVLEAALGLTLLVWLVVPLTLP